MSQATIDVSLLVSGLEKRIDNDYHRMGRWRIFHRAAGFVLTLLILTLPLVLAGGLASSETTQGKLIALLITLVGGLNAAF